MQSMAAAKLKRVRAVELLSEGKNYDEIAKQVGFSHRGSAHRAVSTALAEREAEDVDHYRQLQLSRLEAMLQIFFPRARGGDAAAAQTVLKILTRIDKLLGLERHPCPSCTGKKTRISDDEIVLGWWEQEDNAKGATSEGNADDVLRQR